MPNTLKKPQHVANRNSQPDSETLMSPQTPSRTMAMAMRNFAAPSAPTSSLSPSSYRAPQHSQQQQPQPMTATEQYWATRALRAEALLEAQDTHKREVQTIGQAHDVKRERELAVLGREYKEKHASLERLLIFLFVLIGILILVIIYLTTHYTKHSLQMQSKRQERWWSAIGASHFTIPILSPFTSVVEQESSVIGSKLIGTLAAIAACFAYFAFRYWLTNQAKTTTSAPSSDVASSALSTIARVIS